jgi:hypothetical protein
MVVMRVRHLAYSLFPILGALSFGAGSRPSWTMQVFAFLLCTCFLEVAYSLAAVSRMDTGRPSLRGRNGGGSIEGQKRCVPCPQAGGNEGMVMSSIADGLRNGLASGMASATCKTLLHPFDVIKTVQQASKQKLGMMQAINKVSEESGCLSLFTRGLDVTLIGSVPSIAVYFGAYQFFKKALSFHMGPAWKHTSVALSATLANSIAAFFRVPAELVKQRVQAGLHENAAAAAWSIYQRSGIWGFIEFRSVLAQMLRDIPYAVVMLVIYEGELIYKIF